MISTEFISENKKQGTYAGIHFSDATKKAVARYIEENSIPNPTPSDKLHATLLYSRKKCPHYKAAGDISPAWIGEATDFDCWKAQPDDDGNEANCLVLEFVCPELNARHEELMEEHKATFDYPSFKTHITFSYDIGEMEHKSLPEFEGPIELVHEYGEELNLDWAKDESK